MNPHIFLINPSHKIGDNSGHYQAYDLGLAEEFQRLNFGVSLVTQSNHFADTEIIAKYNFVPILDYDIWGNYLGTTSPFSAIESLTSKLSFLHSNHPFEGHAIFVFTNATQYQIDACIEFLQKGYEDTTVMLIIRYHVELYRKIQSPLVAEYIKRKQLILLSDSEILAKDLVQRETFPSVNCLTVPTAQELSGQSFDENSPKYVLSLGNPRGEKGFCEIVDVAIAMKDYCEKRNIVFRLHSYNPSGDVIRHLNKLKKLELSHIEFYNESLSDSEYRSLLMSSSLVLLPYSEIIYSGRTSGVLVEALVYGVPIVVSERTWLAKISQHFSTGVTCKFGDETSLMDCIKEVFQNYEKYFTRAKTSSYLAKDIFSFSRLAKEIIEVWESCYTKKIAVFYPWSVRESSFSGAGYRLNCLLNFLKNYNVHLEVFSPQADIPYISGVVTKELHISNSDSMQSHIAYHQSSISYEVNKSAIESINSMDGLVFEGTHLVLPVTRELKEIDKKQIIITSHDILRVPYSVSESRKLIDLQVDSLRSGHAFSVNEKESGILSDFGLNVRWSPHPHEQSPFVNLLTSHKGSLGFAENSGLNISDKIVLFVGSDYGPNHEALSFITTLARQLERSRPDIKFVIAGSVSPRLQKNNIIALGRVSSFSLTCLYGQANLVISPLFSGTGSPSKTIEAIGSGCTVLATPCGARGLPVDDISNLHVVPISPTDWDVFASSICSLLDKDKRDISRSLNRFDDLQSAEKAFKQFAQILSLEIRRIEEEEWFKYFCAFMFDGIDLFPFDINEALLQSIDTYFASFESRIFLAFMYFSLSNKKVLANKNRVYFREIIFGRVFREEEIIPLSPAIVDILSRRVRQLPLPIQKNLYEFLGFVFNVEVGSEKYSSTSFAFPEIKLVDLLTVFQSFVSQMGRKKKNLMRHGPTTRLFLVIRVFKPFIRMTVFRFGQISLKPSRWWWKLYDAILRRI